MYIVRSTNPLTGIAVNIAGGRVIAEGVTFYVTNNPAYSTLTGGSDATDGETEPAAPGVVARCCRA